MQLENLQGRRSPTRCRPVSSKVINDLVDTAIESRGTVGIIGLLTAAYSAASAG